MSFFYHLISAGSAAEILPAYDYAAQDLPTGTALSGWPNRGDQGAAGDLILNRNPPFLIPTGGPGGKPAVRFAAYEDHFKTAGNFQISGNSPRTYIIITRSQNVTRHYFSHGVGDYYAGNFSFGNSVARLELAMAGIDMYVSQFLPEYWQIVAIKFNPVPGGDDYGVTMKVDANPFVRFAATSLNTALTPLMLGSGNFAPANSNYELARFQAWDVALSDANLTAQMAALAQFYGLPY